jgi:hypothetical protein
MTSTLPFIPRYLLRTTCPWCLQDSLWEQGLVIPSNGGIRREDSPESRVCTLCEYNFMEVR